MICFRIICIANIHNNNNTETEQSFCKFKGHYVCRFDGFAKVIGRQFVLYYGGDNSFSISDFKTKIKKKNELEFSQIKGDII